MDSFINFESTSIIVPDTNKTFKIPIGTWIQASTTTPLTLIAKQSFLSNNKSTFTSIKVPCDGVQSRITHVSVSFDDLQVFDAEVPAEEGWTDFELYGYDDKTTNGIKEITVVLEADIPSGSTGLILKDITVKLFQEYN
ncbi:hypothetical protein GGI35DRAFT_298705 [Trichoderma velutinum]